MDEVETAQEVPKHYRKLRIVLDPQVPYNSRIVDIESGDEILIEDMQIVCGRATKYGLEVLLTLKAPDGIEIVMKE